MLQQQVYITNLVFMALDAMCIIGAGYIAYFGKHYLSGFRWSMDPQLFIGSVLVLMFLNNYMMGRMDLYSDRKPSSAANFLLKAAKSLFVVFLFFSAGIFVMKQKEYSRAFLLMYAAAAFLLITLYRLAVYFYMARFAARSHSARKILLIGTNDRTSHVAGILQHQLTWGHEIVACLDIAADGTNPGKSAVSPRTLSEILQNQPIDEIIFAADGDRSIEFQRYLGVAKERGITFRILPAMWIPEKNGIRIETIQGLPFLTVPTNGFNAAGLLYKRILDVIGGCVGIFFFLLVYPIVGLAIKLDSPGPILFKQTRMGQHGRLFKLYKFRSMYVDADEKKEAFQHRNEMHGAIFKASDDPRITRVGQWIRRFSIDEIPQFVNVLKGEMSLVGARPPTLDEVRRYRPDHMKRISAKPGITGLWQVSGRNKIKDFEKIVELDCWYMDHWRFLNDLKILCKTVVVVLQRKGAL